MSGGGRVSAAPSRGGYGGGYGGGYRGGYGYGGYRGGYGFGFGLGLGYGYGYPYYGYYGYPYYSSYYPAPAYDYGSYYDSTYQDPGPPVTYSQPQVQAPAPGPAPVRDYQAPPPGRAADGRLTGNQSSMYLIAFPNGSVQVAIAYWTENGTLHYVTSDKQQKTAPLSSIDQAMTRQLNHERGITMNFQ